MAGFWFFLSGLSAVLSIPAFYNGFSKLFYNGSKYRNAYVGGDAYNYIINSTQSTSFFVIAGICVVAAGLLLIAGYLHLAYNKRNSSMQG